MLLFRGVGAPSHTERNTITEGGGGGGGGVGGILADTGEII